MKRKIPIEIVPKPSKRHLLPGLKNGVWDCDVFQSLLMVGIVTSPPRHSGFHLATFWAWLRYSAAIRKNVTALQLRRAWSDVDPHQKTILADDFGMGFSCHYLVDCHGFDSFADTRYVLDAVFGKNLGLKKIAKNGSAKSPDFIAIDNNNDLHILECKGSQSSLDYLKTAMNKGVRQKKNVKNLSSFKSSMVGGFYVPLHNAKDDAKLLFQDPDVDPRLEQLSSQHKDETIRAVRRLSFAKTLVAAGLYRTANTIELGRVDNINRDFVRDLRRGELGFLDYQKSGNDWQKIVEYRAFESDSEEEGAYVPERAIRIRLTIDIPDSLLNLFAQAVTDGGAINLSILDQWLSQQRSSTSSRVASQSSQFPWHGEEDSETESQITTPEGIRFRLAQTPYVAIP